MPRGNRVIIKKKVGRAPTNRNAISKVTSDTGGIAMEDTITKYCGTDWLDKLEEITGSCTTIDLDTYKKAIADITVCEKNIKTLFKRLIKQSFGRNMKTLCAISEKFNTLSTTYAIAEKSVTRKLKNSYKGKKGTRPAILNETNSTEVVADDYVPVNIVKSDWYLCIKDIEKTIYRVMEKIFISPDGEGKTEKTGSKRKNMYKERTYENYQEVIKKHPNIQKLYTPLDIEITNQAIFDSITGLQRYANIIINLVMTPMYDVHTKITKSYERTLAPAFKAQIAAGKVTKDVVISLLSDFIIAKYRATLTGSNKYMLQMLSSEITEGQLAGLDGARFADIMETIDLEAIDRTSKVASFATKAKDILRTISSSGDKLDITTIHDVKELLGDGPEETITSMLTELPPEVAEELAKYDSILDVPKDMTDAIKDEASEDADEKETDKADDQ